MSKSKPVRIQLSDGVAKVEHEHLVETVKLPAWLHIPPNVLDSEKKLVDHLRQHDVVLPVLQAGLAQSLINYRAHTRQLDKDKNAIIRENVKWKPNYLPAPPDPMDKAIQTLKNAGYSREQILAKLGL